MKLSPDFKEFVELLNSNNVRYLLIGGYALAAHGHPRYTKDLDLWLWPDADNAKAIINAIESFGFEGLNLTAQDFMTPDQVIQLGYPPTRIDLLTGASGIKFEDCWKARQEVLLDGIRFNLIDLEDLKKNKRASGRPQDLADIAALEDGN